MNDAINWFELPVADIARAQRFYETALGLKLHFEIFGGLPNAIFPAGGGVRGALVQDPRARPSREGTRVYLDAPDIDGCLARVATAGGKVLLGKTDIGDPGFIAMLEDSEGNLVGLNQRKAR